LKYPIKVEQHPQCDDLLTLTYNANNRSFEASFSCRNVESKSSEGNPGYTNTVRGQYYGYDGVYDNRVTTMDQGYGGPHGNGSSGINQTKSHNNAGPHNANWFGGYDLVKTSKTSTNKYVTLLGRRRKVVMQGRKKMVNVKGSLVSLSEAKKLDKRKHK